MKSVRKVMIAASAIALAALPLRADDDVETRTLDLKDFSAIVVSGATKLDVKVGKSFSVTFTAGKELLERTTIVVKDDTLILKNLDENKKKKNIDWKTSDVILKVTMPELHEIKVTGAVSGKASGIRSDNFALDISGAADLTLSGTCGRFDMEVAGAGNLDAEDFICDHGRIEVAGVGNADVHATKSIEAEIGGLANIVVRGNPDNVKRVVGGLGRIRVK